MTTPTMVLAWLAENGADVDLLRQRVQFMAQHPMEIDVKGRCGADYDERALGMSGESKSEVSRLCEELDERVHAPWSGPSKAAVAKAPKATWQRCRVHLGPFGQWTYTTRWDTIPRPPQRMKETLAVSSPPIPRSLGKDSSKR